MLLPLLLLRPPLMMMMMMVMAFLMMVIRLALWLMFERRLKQAWPSSTLNCDNFHGRARDEGTAQT
jgi:hypothetical protein